MNLLKFYLLFDTPNEEGVRAFYFLPKESFTDFAATDKLEQAFFATGYL